MKTLAEEAKAAGFKTLAELGEIAEVPTQTLRNWHKKSPELFADTVRRAVEIKNDCN